MDADKPAQRKSYAGNTTLEIFEVLWRHSYFGHGLTVRQILDELARKHQLEDPSELPTEKTIRNQLKKLTATEFLGRHIGHLAESDLAGIECKNPQPGWYLDAFLSTAEMRLLLDSLTLSRISLDTMDDLIGKIRELAGAAGQATLFQNVDVLALHLAVADQIAGGGQGSQTAANDIGGFVVHALGLFGTGKGFIVTGGIIHKSTSCDDKAACLLGSGL